MELRQLTYFCAVAKHGGFRRAAENLCLTQSALSQQIKRLEKELGVELIDRRYHPIRLTDAGAHFFPLATQILADVERTTSELRDYGNEDRGNVILGTMQYLTGLEVPNMIATFRESIHSLSFIFEWEQPANLRQCYVTTSFTLRCVTRTDST